jgi:hypothetical protein
LAILGWTSSVKRGSRAPRKCCQDIFRGNRRVGLEFEDPVAVVLLPVLEGLARLQDQAVEVAPEVSLGREQTHT